MTPLQLLFFWIGVLVSCASVVLLLIYYRKQLLLLWRRTYISQFFEHMEFKGRFERDILFHEARIVGEEEGFLEGLSRLKGIKDGVCEAPRMQTNIYRRQFIQMMNDTITRYENHFKSLYGQQKN